ncbi:MAG: hypothetical protein R3F62_11070 [Planctomycetota bacterium]
MPRPLTSRADVERYVFNMLREHYVGPEVTLTLDTTLAELERAYDPELYGTDPTLSIEDDLGLEIPEADAARLDKGRIGDLVDYVVKRLRL